MKKSKYQIGIKAVTNSKHFNERKPVSFTFQHTFMLFFLIIGGFTAFEGSTAW